MADILSKIMIHKVQDEHVGLKNFDAIETICKVFRPMH